MGYCGKCGTKLNDGAKFCQKCGASVSGNTAPISESRNASLYIRWEGKWALIDRSISIMVNGHYVGDYSYKDGFEVAVPIDSSTMSVEIEFAHYIYRKNLVLIPNENYSLNLVPNTLSGSFGFLLCDNDGIEIQRDFLGGIMSIICFIIPIIGIIYALAVWNEKPGTSRSALTISVLGFVVWFIVNSVRYL